MNEQHAEHVGYPYAGRYAGQPIRLTDRNTAEGEEIRTISKRYRMPQADPTRAGHYSGTHPENGLDHTADYLLRSPRPPAQQRPPVPDEVMDDYDEPRVRPHTTSRRLDRNPLETRVLRQYRFDRERFLIVVGVAMLVMLLGWMALSALGQWWQGVQDNWTYGMPRTFQIDEYVGQGDSLDHPDHFIAVNLKGVVEVIELNPQHPQLDHIYAITTTSDPSNPVTLSFPEVSGKQYMYVSIGDSNPYIVQLVNNGKQFVAPGQH